MLVARRAVVLWALGFGLAAEGPAEAPWAVGSGEPGAAGGGEAVLPGGPGAARVGGAIHATSNMVAIHQPTRWVRAMLISNS